MQDVLERLVELQQVDNKIHEIDTSKRDYPETIKKLKGEIAGFEKEITEKGTQIKDLEKEQKHFETEIESANDFLKKSQERLSSVKNNREYDAMQEQIDTQREKISESETEILRIMNALEELQAELKERQESFDEMKDANEKEIERLEQLLSSIEEKRAEQVSEREKISVRVEKRILTAYERIRKGYKNGVAVATIVREACGGCFQRIPPQQIAEVRKSERLITCEICGRILVWSGEDES